MADHSALIGAFQYRGVLMCAACIAPDEQMMTGRFFGWPQVRGSGWTCDRCGVELETREAPDAE